MDGPILNRGPYTSLKDPCPVFDGETWHLYGTGCMNGWGVFYATAPEVTGPWTFAAPIVLPVIGPEVCAPGVIYADGQFRMAIQDRFSSLGGMIHFLHSPDGITWDVSCLPLLFVPGTPQAGLYDGHPTKLGDRYYLVYSGMGASRHGDIYLADAALWSGPWVTRGCILQHAEVPFHNQEGDPAYEWGLEGPQLLPLPDGRVLLLAVCFLAGYPEGERQRTLFATADHPEGPYTVCGTLDAGTGENGHAAGIWAGTTLHLFYQARNHGPWGIYHRSAGWHATYDAYAHNSETWTMLRELGLEPDVARHIMLPTLNDAGGQRADSDLDP